MIAAMILDLNRHLETVSIFPAGDYDGSYGDAVSTSWSRTMPRWRSSDVYNITERDFSTDPVLTVTGAGVLANDTDADAATN